jgi:hypothetical protein
MSGKRVKIMICAMFIAISIPAVYAGAGGKGGANGGNGTPGVNGRPGMPGCPGGTSPSPSGKFYLPNSKQECNPAKNSAKKRHKITQNKIQMI